jgi:mannose-1-phosphate guanylyltransferase
MACVVLAACGSSNNSSSTATPLTPQQYKQFLRRLSQREDRAHVGLEQSLHGKGVPQLKQALITYASDQESVASELSAVKPPQNAQAAQAQLEKASRDTAVAIHAVIPKVAQANSLQAALLVIQSAKGAQRAGQETDAALAQLQKLGYTKAS